MQEFLAAATRGGGLGGLDGASGGLTGARASAALAAAAKRRRSKGGGGGGGSGADRKASKGGRLRFEVLPKLENFMFPVHSPAPPLNVAELFASLFGGQHRLKVKIGD